MMKLLLDVGHSRIKYAAHNGERWMHGEPFKASLDLDHFSLKREVSEIWVASVRERQYNLALSAFLSERYSRKPRFAKPCETLNAYKSLYRQDQLGVDRYLAGLAAHRRLGAAVVVDYGTALTVDAIDSEACHRGGVIMPGERSLRQALADRAGLPLARGSATHAYFARNTGAAISSGCFFMLSAAVRSVVMAMQNELSGASTVALTGGNAARLSWPETMSVYANPHLVIEGLFLYSQRKADNIGSVRRHLQR